MSLKSAFVQAAVAAADLARARRFYETTLGLEPKVQAGGVRYPCGGGSWLFLYESPTTAGSAQHTVAGWYVSDLSAVMADLRSRGATFEHYDEGTPTDEEGVFATDTFRAAWLRDPDGNTLALQEYFRDEPPHAGERSTTPLGEVFSVVHVEVRGTHPADLQTFYAGLAGWTFDASADGARVVADVSEPGRYGFVDLVGASDGAGVPAGVGGGPGHMPYAIFYLGVPDVSHALAKAEQLGGRRETEPVRAPGRDLTVARVRDPEGNLFGLAGPG